MTISLSENTPRISYSVNEGASQTAFTVPFEFYAEADLNFYVDGTKKTIATHYTVSGGDGTTGTINTTSGNTVTGISGGSTVVITRSIALARTTDFPASGPFAISTLNTELDKFIAIQADNDDTIDRALHLADDDTAVSMELPLVASRKGTVLGFNASTGAAEVGPTIANVNSLSAITANINTTAGIAANVTTVAGIAANVTTVAGVASNVTTVAGSISNVNALAASAVIADMALLATTDVIADMALLATSDVIADMNTLATSAIVADLNILATTDIVADMALLATSDIVSDLNTLATADIVSDLNLLATSDIVSDINTLATSDIVSDLNTLATSDIVTDLNLLATSAIVEDLNLLATSTVIADMATLAGSGANPNITTLTASGEIAAASLDISGNIDVDGTTNLDVVDIDGAVNMATTALVTGVLTTTAATVFNGGFASNAASTITTADNLDVLTLISTDADENSGPKLSLTRNSASPADNDYAGLIAFNSENSADESIRMGMIRVQVLDVTDATEDSTLTFYSRHGGVETQRIATTATGIDVTGTVTADGLTVDGGNTIRLNPSSGDDFLTIAQGTTDASITADSAAGNANLKLFTTASGTTTERLDISFNGDISFYEDTGSTARFFWDASAERLVIGDNTVSPSGDAGDLVVGGSTGNNGITIGAATGGTGSLRFADTGGTGRGIVLYDHSSDYMSFHSAGAEAMRIDESGNVTMPAQPAFSAIPAATQSNIAINSVVTVVFGTERFDVGANFASNTFTAPVTGKYSLHAHLRLEAVDSAANYYMLRITTSNEEYQSLFTATSLSADAQYWSIAMNCLADMDANDTAVVTIYQNSGTSQTDIQTESYFNGILVA